MTGRRPSRNEPPSDEAVATFGIGVSGEVDLIEWEELCRADPRATVFHRPRWNQLYARHHRDCRAWWLEARDARGRLVGGLPLIERRRWGFCRVHSGVAGSYGGPVVRPGTTGLVDSLLRDFLRWGQPRALSHELVWAHATPPARVDEGGLEPLDTAVLDVGKSFEDFLMCVFPKNRRNECNRSDRRGLRAECSRSAEWLEQFLPIYHEQSRAWGSPAESDAFLRAVLREIPEARLFVSRDRNGEVMGAHLCFELADELFAWLGTTRRLADIFPSSLLVREEARYCSLHGLERLNLGSSLGLEGVHRYKRLLGARNDPRWILRQRSGLLRLWQGLGRRRRTR